MKSIAIETKGISKRYRIGTRQERYRTLREALGSFASAPLRLLRDATISRGNFIWALEDVSLQVNEGEAVGIIGRNGAGKTTLLKLLARITDPTRGEALIRGRVGSLLEVGTGFHYELTGRENIYLNGAILGMRKVEIDRRFEEIVAFAEIEEFIDTPVKRYSSGMFIRLAFSVAAHLEPEILLVDEVLSVGDAAFQKKCLGKMEEVATEGRTVLFVSHNMGAVQHLCDRGIVIENGRVFHDGPVSEAVAEYLKALDQAASSNLLERTDRRGAGIIKLARIELSGEGGGPPRTGQPARFVFHLTDLRPSLRCNLRIYNQAGQPVLDLDSGRRGPQDLRAPWQGQTVVCEVEELLLLPGRYRMDVGIISDGVVQDHLPAAFTFDIGEAFVRGRRVPGEGKYGSVCVHHRWLMP